MSEHDENNGRQPARTVLPFYNLRLRFLMRPRAILWVYCYPCKTERPVDLPALIERLGADAGIAEIEKKGFRCRVCRGTFTRMRVEWLEDAPALSTDF